MRKAVKIYQWIFLFVLSGIGSAAYSQTITIGSGTQTNGPTSASPINIWYRKVVSHFVFTAAEINAAGYTGAGTIHKIGWFISQAPQYSIPGYRIQMKHTTATNAAGIGNGGWVNAKSPATYTPNQGDWDLLTLDTPFAWDGVQNLAIRICWTQVQPTYSSSGQCRIINTGSGYEYRWSDNPGNGCGQNPNTLANYKPQARIVFDTLTTWTGVVSTDWFNAANWTAGVPDERMDAVIPGATPFDPNLTGIGLCEELILNGSMTCSGGGDLQVHDDFRNAGTWIDNGGMLTMTGSGVDSLITTPATFTTLRIENDGLTTLDGGLVTIDGELQVVKSTLFTNDSLLIKSDALGTARIDELQGTCTYTLNMFDSFGDGWNGGLITVFENGVEIGIFSAEGAASSSTFNVSSGSSFSLDYSSGSFENENTYTLSDPSLTPIFNDGPTPSTGTVYTGTASCAFNAPITGNIVMERHIDAGETYWRYFGSAVQGATLAQFNDDFVTAGYPGSWFPNFGWVSAYNYNETLGPGLGYLETTGATQVIGVGEGWQIWCGDTITGTQPFTFDFRGVPNQGDINMPVTYTNFGLPNEDGFNLVANPYPSTIDWDDLDWTKTNMANAVYIQNPDNQQYATYVAGASTNGGSRYIASQQSFWVQAFAASPVLTATEGVKSSNDQPFIKSDVASPGMTISLLGNLEFDEAILRRIDGATEGFDHHWDATKYWGGWGNYPQVSLLNPSGDDQTVQSLNTSNQEYEIPLRAIVFQNGNYDLKFENVSEMDVPCMLLEDTYDGSFYPISEGVSYTFTMSDTTYAPRFMLHVGRDYEITTTNASCFAESDGVVELDLDNPNPFDYELMLDGNSTFGNDMVDPLNITGLVSGVYTLEIPTFSNLCGVTTFNFVIQEPSPFSTNPTVENEVLGFDGSIEINMSGGTAPYDYFWDTGYTTSSITGLTAGIYSVEVTDANDCIFNESYTVESYLSLDDADSDSELSFHLNNTENKIVVQGQLAASETVFYLYSSTGQLLNVYNLDSQSGNQSIILPSNLAEGIYILKGATAYFKFKK